MPETDRGFIIGTAVGAFISGTFFITGSLFSGFGTATVNQKSTVEPSGNKMVTTSFIATVGQPIESKDFTQNPTQTPTPTPTPIPTKKIPTKTVEYSQQDETTCYCEVEDEETSDFVPDDGDDDGEYQTIAQVPKSPLDLGASD